jgi:hypothetical protein
MKGFIEVMQSQTNGLGYLCTNNECLGYRHATAIISNDVLQHATKTAV